MKNLDDNPTSNWGMTVEQWHEQEAVKEKFQLPENSRVISPEEAEELITKHKISKQDTTPQKGKKFDQGKPRMDLLPPKALNEVAKVLSFGAKKYGCHNWRSGLKWSRLAGASLRHITAWISGETNDPESGFNHLAHAACNLLMLIESTELDLGEDDRWTE